MPRPARAVDGWSDRYRACDKRATLDAWCGEQSAEATLLSRRAYHANITFVDEQVGRIHATLKETGLLTTTLWVFTSDHGDAQVHDDFTALNKSMA